MFDATYPYTIKKFQLIKNASKVPGESLKGSEVRLGVGFWTFIPAFLSLSASPYIQVFSWITNRFLLLLFRCDSFRLLFRQSLFLGLSHELRASRFSAVNVFKFSAERRGKNSIDQPLSLLRRCQLFLPFRRWSIFILPDFLAFVDFAFLNRLDVFGESGPR